MDTDSQMRVGKLLSRVPNRKLLQLDFCNPYVKGKFGAVYQDFFLDPVKGLEGGLDRLKASGHLKVVILPSSRYGCWVLDGVKEFCARNSITLEVQNSLKGQITKGDVFLILTGRLSNELAEFDILLQEKGLKIGTDIGLISYNDVPLNAVVLGGLTTISTDFVKMGETAASMILGGKMFKVHNDFRMIRRKTF